MSTDRLDRTISEVTRRNIADSFVLEKICWWGRFEEQRFLARLYDLSRIPSSDPRFENASQDIFQHRQRNLDWADDWVFYDSRFNLLGGSDDQFLRFLCETVHPAVQPDEHQVEKIVKILNGHLQKDGWEIREEMKISGRPVFASLRTFGSDAYAAETARVVNDTIDAKYVSRQITRMHAAMLTEPDLAIGTAKEFIETTCKTILRQRNVQYDSNEKMPRLVKQLASELELIPAGASGGAKAADTVKRLLSNLGSISDGLSELRNLHGTGHGKEADVGLLELRHARLAVGAATALAVFLLEAHMESMR